MENNGRKGFPLTTKFYKNENDATILAPEKKNLEGNSAVHLEGVAVNKQ